MNYKDENRYFYTSSFPLACYLFAKEEQLAGIRPPDTNGRREFTFVRNPVLEELADAYRFGREENVELLIHVRFYEQARRKLRELLNEK